MKIAAGVITTGLRELRDYKCAADTIWMVEYDRLRTGVACARNRLLKRLSETSADIFVLFDDDCYPRMPGWEDMIRAAIDSYGGLKGSAGVLGIPNPYAGKLIVADPHQPYRQYWMDVMGCFSVRTRRAFETTGYYNTIYTKYGFEDAGYHARVSRSLLKLGRWPTWLPLSHTIHSEDLYGENPVPIYTMEEKQAFIEANRPLYQLELMGPTYLPFDGEHLGQ